MASSPTWNDVAYLYVWPESERLKAAMANGRSDIVYTLPTVKYTEMLRDKMSYAASQLGTDIIRPAVHTSVAGVKELIDRGCLRMAFNLTTTLLTNLEIGRRNTTDTFELWSCRFQLMMALKLYNPLAEELAAFDKLDAPDVYFQYYIDLRQQGYIGSMIPFQMRLIHAELPRYLQDPMKGIEYAVTLEKQVSAVIDSLTAASYPTLHTNFWQKRLEVVREMKARLWFAAGDLSTAMAIYADLAHQASDERRGRLLQLQLRLAMASGDEKLVEMHMREITLQNSRHEDFYLHKSFREVFLGNYTRAIEYVQSAAKEESTQSSTIANNESVYLLYNGQAEEAKRRLTAFSASEPSEAMLTNTQNVCRLVAREDDEAKKQLLARHCQQMTDVLDPEALNII